MLIYTVGVEERLWTADCGLRTADCGLRTADCGLRTADCGLRTADCGQRTADCGLRTAARVPTAFLVLQNFHSCLYNSIETGHMFSMKNFLIKDVRAQRLPTHRCF